MTFHKAARVACCAVILTCASGALSAPALARSAPPSPAVHHRIVLPSAVTPDHYRIDITPDAKALTFQGAMQVDVTVHQPTDKIVLNSADIVIDSAALSGDAKAPVVSYDDKEQTATFAVGHVLKPGAYTLSLVYTGKIYEQASGFFALDYDTPAGKKRALFTQFENSDARRFVPSWDEPGRKATFQLTVNVPADQMPISNMPIASSSPLPGGQKRVQFATTPKMSSYLLFFGLGDFERVHRDVNGVDVGVVVKRGDTAQAQYALDAAAHILPYYNDYFGTRYPLPKLDLIAGPGSSQFFGAMENWGAIFYFERDLLIDPRVSTESDRQNVYIVVAHEMAHQWFGDLVTMEWWNDLWLNEGFASWMENKATDHFHPEWNLWLQSLSSKQVAMQVDAKDGTHPIITPIDDVLQASGAFDTITYSKGEAVIRMLESYVGADAWRAGVRRYIHDHAYGNTVTDDLWKEIDKGASRPITQMAHDFTLQAGVPMISETAHCAGGKTTAGLSQGHFAIDPDSTQARVWHVPVAAETLGAAPTKTVISGAKTTPMTVVGCAPLIVNAGQTAYFRTRYSKDGLAAISAHYGQLGPDDQLGIFNDTASLAYNGDQPMAALMDLIAHFPPGADPVVAETLAGRLRGLDSLYQGLPTQPAFRAYARSVLNPIFARLGWEKKAGESDNTALLRSSVIAALGQLGDPAVLVEAHKRFENYVADPSSLNAATRRSVLRIVAVHADAATWDQLHTLAKSAKSQLERQELYGLLGDAEDKALAQRALDLAVSGEPPATTTPSMIRNVADLHPELAFDFAVAHWDQIANLLEPSTQSGYMPRLIGNASDLKLIAKLDAFAKDHIPSNARQDLRKSESTVRYLAKVRMDRLPEVDHWLGAESR
jgi:aminopeptidase N